MSSLRVGIVGTGFGATVHAPSYALHPRFEVVAIAPPSSAEGVAAERKMPHAFASTEAVLAGVELGIGVDGSGDLEQPAPPLRCLRAEEAVTNWENGLFIAEDVAWAVRRLRQSARLGAGDLCGAYSESEYARGFQRFAARWDHPKTAPVRLEHAREVNLLALGKLWPALIGQPVTDPA